MYLNRNNPLCLQQLCVKTCLSICSCGGSPVEGFRPRGDGATVVVETRLGEVDQAHGLEIFHQGGMQTPTKMLEKRVETRFFRLLKT